MITNEDLDAMEARANAATVFRIDGKYPPCSDGVMECIEYVMRKDIPALIAALRAERKAGEELRDAADKVNANLNTALNLLNKMTSNYEQPLAECFINDARQTYNCLASLLDPKSAGRTRGAK